MDEKNAKNPRLLRLPQIIAPDGPIPVGKSTWWSGVADGRFPKPIKLGPRISVWKKEDIEALIEYGPLESGDEE